MHPYIVRYAGPLVFLVAMGLGGLSARLAVTLWGASLAETAACLAVFTAIAYGTTKDWPDVPRAARELIVIGLSAAALVTASTRWSLLGGVAMMVAVRLGLDPVIALEAARTCGRDPAEEPEMVTLGRAENGE